ncbi:transglycosylase domain-containing protein [Salipaludibacillus aurantiacus]|uniref:Penicillin-binding protein n=1 Tax=Salipaludibacillus aurantiacus TaxID=1601833 RepID=A0A1H9WND3_9BACI|nr:transglycosylase domain-containing protein [Salipaludibacillus aurantiacus]SES35385.1 penicillin-binding protein [Salipaludibacillus aurantiacus]
MSDRRSITEFFNRKEPQYVFKGVRVTSQVLWNLFLIFSALALISLFFVGGAAAGYFASLVQDEPVPSYEEMQNEIYDYESATEIYFADDIYLGDMPTPLERREIPLEDMSQTLIEAVIATEDEYFFEHEGIVPKALFRAVYQDFSGASTQTGGSTLTQQLIKNQLLTSEVTHDRKAAEILLAMRTENFFEKEEILEAYMNVVPFGRNANGRQVAGAQAAAQGIFGVDASELNIAQAAFIAGLPQSPFAYTPFTGSGEVKENFDAALHRMDTVLSRMHSRGYINDEELEEARNYDIRANLAERQPTSLDEYPFIIDEVRRRAEDKLTFALMEKDEVDLDAIEDDDRRNLMITRYREEAERALQRNGYKIHTTINKDIYDAQQEVIENFEYFDKDRPETLIDQDGEEVEVMRKEEPGSMLLENSTGAILSFVGGRDFEHQNFNHATRAERSTGSTMKPLLTYAIGFETGELQPGFITPDTTFYYNEDDEDSELSNFDNKHRGLITAREANASSRNVPAVREFKKIDHEVAREALINYGFGSYMDESEPYLSTPLGTIDLTVEANTSAYSTFGNEGKRKDPFMIAKIETQDGEVLFEHEEKETEIISPQTNYLMIDIMRDVLVSGGTAFRMHDLLNFEADWAGKTGTSNEIIDAWFVGFNPNVTQGLWIGYDDRDPISEEVHNMSYSHRTQLLWAELANAAYEVDSDLVGPSEDFESPGGIVEQTICGISGKLPSDLCREAGLVTTDLFNSEFVPDEEDDSLTRVQYVRVKDGAYKALDSTPSEFTRSGVAIKEEYFDFAEDEDLSQYIPDGWDDLVPDREAPDNGKTPDTLRSVSSSGGSVTWDSHHEDDIIGYRVYNSSGNEVASIRWDEDYSYSGSGTYYVTAVDTAGRESSSSNEVTTGGSSSDDDDESSSDDNNDGENGSASDELFDDSSENDSDNNNDNNNSANNDENANDNSEENNNDSGSGDIGNNNDNNNGSNNGSDNGNSNNNGDNNSENNNSNNTGNNNSNNGSNNGNSNNNDDNNSENNNSNNTGNNNSNNGSNNGNNNSSSNNSDNTNNDSGGNETNSGATNENNSGNNSDNNNNADNSDGNNYNSASDNNDPDGNNDNEENASNNGANSNNNE